ncbi:hypothetical protein MLD38_005609 [Melastoma candidum]|uniref:Uncharacterized protein n=1 Tax=Melastoma candidum TaxID=119954 RepID=A0ACB9RJL2_9MYRT|nr:hypothetical protein MLD38_005609 [Melastoma candidum]
MDDVFSMSSRDEDNEEALKWAALEKLPTLNRLRKGILSSDRVNEVDVTELGPSTRRRLLERLVRVAEEDNESFLLKIRQRIDRVGIDLPTIEVRFENLNVEAEAHEGTRALPSLINFSIGMIEGMLSALRIVPSKKKNFMVLNNVSGIIKPGRLTLLLGPPSSGKTALLLALAGKLDSQMKSSGKITYNGHGLDEFVPERTAAYISQHDQHTGEMTVRETLTFSARCQGVGTRYDMLAELARREKMANIKPDPDIDVYMKAIAMPGQEANAVTDYVIKILGLEICADTLVGNEMLRGISGGQRKRVTTGEMLVGPVRALFMDEISTGLDSSTTYQIVNSLKHVVHILNSTAIISLLQPAPETYDLFDDIILLSDGQIVYQGPRELILDFFESMGFKCPERKGVADFLQEVTSRKDQEQYWARRDVPYIFVTVKEFVEAFQSFHVGRKLGDELGSPFNKAKNHPAALSKEKYGVGRKDLLKACFTREILLMKRNSFIYIFKLIQIIVMAIVTMTVFPRTKMHKDNDTDGNIFVGALFFTLVMIMFNGLLEISMTLTRLPVFYKQRDLRFYPAWAYALPTWITMIPISLIEVATFVGTTYYVVGYDPSAHRFFRQYLVLVAVNQTASGLFRLIAGLGRDIVIASTFGSYAMLMLFTLGGVVLSRDDVKKWWKWGYWISPMMYGQNAIIGNEFLGKSWNRTVPGTKESLGILVLRSRGFFTEGYWCWIGFGTLLGYTLLFNFGFALSLTFLNPYKSSQALKSEDAKGSKNAESTPEEAARPSENQKRGMALSFEQHSITFEEIVYSVNMPQEMKNRGAIQDKLVLLNGISGAFRPGVLTALMGVSGAGKTTLMDVLAGRKTGGYIKGSIKISGFPKNQATFTRISGYCEQNDIHSPYVTVYESLVYSAWLRLPQDINTETRKMFIEEVMELVELNPLRDASVGLPGTSGLSTEQRKRLTIAVELVANPSIIFMDEPTSGLDARAAAIVMRTVRNTVDTGRTVVCTIHQPSVDIFESFDELFLLKQGGQEIYVGPLGRHSCHLINYFESIDGVSKIKDGFNPATWMLEITTPAQELALGMDFANIYNNSDLYRRNKDLIKELSIPSPGSSDLNFASQYSLSFLMQCAACLWKQHWSYWRNPLYTAVRLWFTIVIALIFGSIFWNIGQKTSTRQDLMNAMGSMYTAILFIGIQNCSSVQPVVSVERTVFYRERAAGMYSALPYAFAQVLIELPYILVQAVTYAVIVYAMIGFEWTAVKFFWYLYFMYFEFLYFTFYGMMNIALTPSLPLGMVLSSAFYAIWNLFSGFNIPRTHVPIWWKWYSWVCPVSWTLHGLVASQYGDLTNVLDNGQTVTEFVGDYLGFKHDFIGMAAAMSLVFTVLFVVVFALAIKVLNFQIR